MGFLIKVKGSVDLGKDLFTVSTLTPSSKNSSESSSFSEESAPEFYSVIISFVFVNDVSAKN